MSTADMSNVNDVCIEAKYVRRKSNQSIYTHCSEAKICDIMEPLVTPFDDNLRVRSGKGVRFVHKSCIFS